MLYDLMESGRKYGLESPCSGGCGTPEIKISRFSATRRQDFREIPKHPETGLSSPVLGGRKGINILMYYNHI